MAIRTTIHLEEELYAKLKQIIPTGGMNRFINEALREKMLHVGQNTMELESNFEFINSDTIRIKGTRVGIEVVIKNYLAGANPEQIVEDYPALTLKQVYATITYYLFNQGKLDAYVKAGRERVEAAWLEQRRNPPPGVKRLFELQTQREEAR
ncbi:DUF433 domain-containing protein [Candidatus Poribacteria bacterium]|nr:DUF433 domain-containing protein [Candidatus Poribacteria bacterium]